MAKRLGSPRYAAASSGDRSRRSSRRRSSWSRDSTLFKPFRSMLSREQWRRSPIQSDRHHEGAALTQDAARALPSLRSVLKPLYTGSQEQVPLRDPRLLATRSIRSEFFFHISSRRNPPL